MACSLPSYCTLIKPSLASRNLLPLQVRVQSFRDEGRSKDIVDANLSVLRERIEGVKIKERLERCCRCEYGWNYVSGHNNKLKKDVELSWQFFHILGLVFGTIGFTCLSGTLLVCLVSVLIHLNQ